MKAIYQFGEIIRTIAESYGNVDIDRICATGHSQGAGWSYELASVQPELLAAILINAGTTVHTMCSLSSATLPQKEDARWHPAAVGRVLFSNALPSGNFFLPVGDFFLFLLK